MRFVKAKTVEQQDIQATHRIRSELMCHRTAKGNQIRGLVTEYGLVAPLQMASLRRENNHLSTDVSSLSDLPIMSTLMWVGSRSWMQNGKLYGIHCMVVYGI